MIYNPKDKEYDSRKRRVTDLKEWARVTLPKPLGVDEESKIDLRRKKILKKGTCMRSTEGSTLIARESRKQI